MKTKWEKARTRWVKTPQAFTCQCGRSVARWAEVLSIGGRLICPKCAERRGWRQ